MRGMYKSIYRLPGLHKLPDGSPTEIELFNANGRRAAISSDKDRIISDLVDRQAIGMLLLNFFTGSITGDTPEDRLRKAYDLVKISEQLGKEVLLLVIEVEIEVDRRKLERIDQLSNVRYSMWSEDKKFLENETKQATSVAHSAIALAVGFSDFASVTLVGNVLCAVDDDGSLIHEITPSMHGTASSSTTITKEQIDKAKKNAQKIFQKKNYETCFRLLTQAFDTKSDRLKAFLSAWSGMEVFVNKSFAEVYEKNIYEELSKATPKSAAPFLNRLKSIMGGKYKISDKFVLIATDLNPDQADEDINEFNKIKNQRDEFFHSMKGEISDLPLERLRNLFRKYMELFISK